MNEELVEMKMIIYTVLINILWLCSFTKPDLQTFSLGIEVDELRNTKGVVQFALYNKEGSIPDQDYEKYYRILKGEIINGASKVVFRNIPSGSYAVNILHDENEDGKIDKGFFLPKEGIGFSNFESIGLSHRPSFKKASFEVKGNTTIRIKMIYL